MESRRHLAAAPNSPTADLPWNIEQLSATWQRPAFSPDGKKLAFVDGEYGDAWEIDLATRAKRNITARLNHAAGWLRVQYLANGDYMLTGPNVFVDSYTSRWEQAELWVLPAGSPTAPVTRLNQRLNEGAAVSRISNRIAFATKRHQYPADFTNGGTRIYTANISYQNGKPVMLNKKQVSFSNGSFETQDFRNNDSEITLPSYGNGTSKIFTVKTATGAFTTMRSVTGEYNEPEGIFPNGQYTLAESSRDRLIPAGASLGKYLDVWQVRLSPGSDDTRRLTRFGDYPGFRASNPVVSPDGKSIAFQQASINDIPGVGSGVFLMRLDATPARPSMRFSDVFDAIPINSGWTVQRSTTDGSHMTLTTSGGRAVLGKSKDGSAGTISLTRSIDTRGLKDLSVRFSASQSAASFEKTDSLKIEVNSGQGWVRLLTDSQQFRGVDNASGENFASSAGQLASVSTGYLALPRSAANRANVQIRITARMDSANEKFMLDGIWVAGTPSSTAPAAAARAVTTPARFPATFAFHRTIDDQRFLAEFS